ncbi:MAG: hypothetical protein M1834_002046 [Cirrosporium novae-zelandiae]|nr:MAG: hypothetical protein M1834_002046 [Cirrosporium novae-zelandiae]
MILSDPRSMATNVHHSSPVVSSPQSSKITTTNGFKNGSIHPMVMGDERTVVTIFDQGQEEVVEIFADVLGKPAVTVSSISGLHEEDSSRVWGIPAREAKGTIAERAMSAVVVIHTHCVDAGPTDEELTQVCDYEFLYTKNTFFRRDLARFLGFVLGQTSHHEDLIRKERTSFISTTFPDVRTALSDLDILSVGADAVEIRVDLLKEPHRDGTYSSMPSLQYVGEQVMLLRQRTELPIIYTTRCTRENGLFPMEDPTIFYEYLRRAIKWGVEYIDVELWLPEDIRRRLSEEKAHTKIISAFHDFTGEWKWPSAESLKYFKEGAKYGDIVKMIAMISTMDENYQLEYFRSTIKNQFPNGPPLAAVNMGQVGQLSRALNTVFTPITHPLLPIIAAPGQLSAAEINGALHIMGQLQKREIYAIGPPHSMPHSLFFEKCFNELGLPHHFSSVNRGPKGCVENFLLHPNFGGAYLFPPLPTSSLSIPALSDSARAIGLIDTITVSDNPVQPSFMGDNASWKGIRATLTRDFVPSAYRARPGLILSSSEPDAAAVIYALRSLHVSPIYTVGFKAQGPLAVGLEPITSIESINRVASPFVIISCLPSEKSLVVQPLLRHFGYTPPSSIHNSDSDSPFFYDNPGKKVFVDLAPGKGEQFGLGLPRKGDPLVVARREGWVTYGNGEVSAWTTVEMMRCLVGQNVPCDFVRMAGGRGWGI